MKHFSAQKTIACLTVFLMSVIGAAQQPARIPTERPELIIGIVLDQMRPDQIHKYWDKFGPGGFKKLMNNGTVSMQAGFHYYNTQSAPGSATIATGTQPAVHGIVSDDWFELLHEDMTHATADPSVSSAGGSYENGKYSPVNLLVSTLGDGLKLSTRSQSKVYGIGLENEMAVLSVGHAADAAFWFDTERGNWITSSFYRDSLPEWLTLFNDKRFPDLYLDRSWTPLLPGQPDSLYLPDSLQTRNGFDGIRGFPYDLSRISRIDRRTKDYSYLLCTPFGQTLTMDLAQTLILEEGLGQDEHPDMIMINLSTPGAVAVRFGSGSREMEDVFLRLDRDLEHLLTNVENHIGENRILVFLTATHGMQMEPKYLESLKLPVGRFSRQQALSLLRSYLNVKYGKGEWVKGYYGNSIFLNRTLIEDSQIKLNELRMQVANFMVQFAAVTDAVSATTLSAGEFSENIRGFVQNGYHPKRSGDVLIVLRSGWTLDEPGRTGTGYNYDRKVPLIWYGWKIGKRSIYRDIDMADIAPTLSFFLNIPPPDAASGSPILELLE